MRARLVTVAGVCRRLSHLHMQRNSPGGSTRRASTVTSFVYTCLLSGGRAHLDQRGAVVVYLDLDVGSHLDPSQLVTDSSDAGQRLRLIAVDVLDAWPEN